MSITDFTRLRERKFLLIFKICTAELFRSAVHSCYNLTLMSPRRLCRLRNTRAEYREFLVIFALAKNVV